MHKSYLSHASVQTEIDRKAKTHPFIPSCMLAIRMFVGLLKLTLFGFPVGPTIWQRELVMSPLPWSFTSTCQWPQFSSIGPTNSFKRFPTCSTVQQFVQSSVVSRLPMSCKGTGQKNNNFFFRWCLLVASQTRRCVRMDSGYENHRQTKLNSTTADFQFAFLFMPRALVCAQAFPPLLKQAGGHRFCSLSGTRTKRF